MTAAAVLIASLPCAAAPIEGQIGLNGGHNPNLFRDSTQQSDTHTGLSAAFRYYPTAAVEMSFNGGYTSFRKISDLGGFNWGAALAVTPTSESSAFSLYAEGSMSGRTYGELFSVYDSRTLSGYLAASLAVSPAILVKFGASVGLVTYANSISGDNRGYNLSAGTNFTLPGANCVDLEAGFLSRRFDIAGESTGYLSPGGRTDAADQTGLDLASISLRLSRPLGAATGLSLELAQQDFVTQDGPIEFDGSVDILTPWALWWEGRTVGLGLRNFSIPNMILTAEASHTEKSFTEVLDTRSGDPITGTTEVRHDEQLRLLVGLQRPLVCGAATLLRPSLTIEYIRNASSWTGYEYAGLSVAAGFTVDY
ncbi:MAG: hypothetical protein OEW00_05960 [candidate division Zixibacteria bacterium]|nr:hypothetical protein [candidate division Zixibacteria bacterium]